jgi:rubrerythrin
MEHHVLDFGAEDLKGRLERRITLETEAIDMYKKIIEAVDDPEIIGLSKHILDEERRHRGNGWRPSLKKRLLRHRQAVFSRHYF